MHHYTYKITSESGKYYFGRHSTEKLDDGYLGSGFWIRSIKDKSSVKKTIIAFYKNLEELKEAESKLLNENVGKQGCMNFNNNSVGFASGELNPARREIQKQKLKERLTKDNPSKRDEVRRKMSESHKGRENTGKRAKGYKMTEEERLKISQSRIGIKYSETGRKKLSDSRKKQYENGERILPSMKGKKQSEEAKKLVSISALNREKMNCIHCNGNFKPHTFKRWHGNNCKKFVLGQI